MMNNFPYKYLTAKQLCDKYKFINTSHLKNILTRNFNAFREKVVRKLGRINLFDEEAFLRFIEESKAHKENTLNETNEPK